MLKDVRLIMKKNGEKINAQLLNIFESINSARKGVLYNFKLDLEKK